MNFLRKLRSFEDDLDFRKAFRFGLSVSVALVVLSIACLGLRGLNLGIDFKGGAVWELTSTKLTSDQARTAVGDSNEAAVTVQSVGSSGLRIETGPRTATERTTITNALAKASGISTEDISVSTVGPSWGSEVSGKALRALIFFFIAVAAYISIRLEWRMAVAAIVAVVHDIIISVGVYSVLGLEVTPGTVIAFLTILGYSLYDTIVVFDKVEDNVSHLASSGKSTYTDIVNLSLNQTMMRSINTTLTALLPVLSILIIGAGVMGAVTLEEFGLALLVGLFVGAYSSIFVAAPVLVFQKEREPRYAALRKRIEERGSASTTRRRVSVAAGAPMAGLSDEDDDTATSASASAAKAARPAGAAAPKASSPGTYSANHPPRPRKKGKKR